MLVDQIIPTVVGQKEDLPTCIEMIARNLGISERKLNCVLEVLPPKIRSEKAFFDKLSKTWRYEFGLPYDLDEGRIWGTHMWLPVRTLLLAFGCAIDRLTADQLTLYVKRLSDHEKHLDTLAEMYPMLHLGLSTIAEFEVTGAGEGNSTIDWRVSPDQGRAVLLDVKRRQFDLIQQMQRIEGERSQFASMPDHDPNLLFRSVEKKFSKSHPSCCLQGVWIVTDLKQEESALAQAFDSLDRTKIHFAILGDWRNDSYILARNPDDKDYILELFQIKQSMRFIHHMGAVYDS